MNRSNQQKISVINRSKQAIQSLVLPEYKITLDQIDNALVEFYNSMQSQTSSHFFNSADKKLLLLSAAKFVGQGASFDRCRSLISWAQRIKLELNDSYFQWLFSDIAYKSVCGINDIIRLFSLLCELSVLEPKVISSLKTSDQNVAALCNTLEKQRNDILQQRFPEKSLDIVLKEFSTISQDVAVPLPADELSLVVADYKTMVDYAKNQHLSELSLDDLKDLVQKIKKEPVNIDQQRRLLSLARELIRRQFKIYPYNTQVLTALALLRWPQNLKGRLAQVKTGEGKSTIGPLLEAVLAIQGHYIDLITSDAYLAIRDQKKYLAFFELLGFTTSHICVENPSAQLFQPTIVYGTNYDFEFAFLRDGLSNKPARGQRPYDVVIIDEVDNLLIDRASNSARIAIKDRDHLENLLPHVYQFVKESPKPLEQLSESELLSYLKQQLQKTKNNQPIPDSKTLKKWLISAYKAIHEMKENKDYVVKVQEKVKENKTIHEKAIVIVDYIHTGQLQEGSRWQNGLHEFLEIKHAIPLGESSLTIASVSHPAYFSRYKHIFGLTGTMGERSELKNIYNVDSFDVPPYKPNQRKVLPPQFFKNKEAYDEFILMELKEVISTNSPILILTKTVADSIQLAAKCKEAKIQHQLYNATQPEEADYLISRAGNPGMVTIATNTASRGTDILLSQAALAAKGLYVIFGFYAANKRIWDQGIGRAARQGQDGRARMVVHAEDEEVQDLLALNSQLQIFEDELSDEAIFECLDQLRDIKIRMESQQRQLIAKIEMINTQCLEQFFDKLHHWHYEVNDDFFNQLIKQLMSGVKFAKPLEDKTQEESSYLKLAKQQMLSLKNPTALPNDFIKWLQLIKEYITEDLIKYQWAKFYSKLGDIYDEDSESKNDSVDDYQNKVNAANQLFFEKHLPLLNTPKQFFIQIIKSQFNISLLEQINSKENPVTNNTNSDFLTKGLLFQAGSKAIKGLNENALTGVQFGHK